MTATEREVISRSQEMRASRRRVGNRRVNVSEGERWVSSIGGGALAALGVLRGSWGGLALATASGYLIYRGVSGYCPLFGVLRIDHDTTTHEGVRVEYAYTINQPAATLYEFWRHFENLPQFMSHLQSVEAIDERRSRWVATAPAGMTVEWEAEITADQQNERIAWRSLPGSQIENQGEVRFEPSTEGSGTVVRVVLEYKPPFGSTGALIARLFGEEPRQQVQEDLRRFKRLMETGEIATTEGQPQGRRSALGNLLSPNS
jgi:uncharacterized membrane protein